MPFNSSNIDFRSRLYTAGMSGIGLCHNLHESQWEKHRQDRAASRHSLPDNSKHPSPYITILGCNAHLNADAASQALQTAGKSRLQALRGQDLQANLGIAVRLWKVEPLYTGDFYNRLSVEDS
jgi:hypothetical protein